MTRLFIIGASGHGREVASVLDDAAQAGRALGEVVGFLDDDPALHGKTVNGLLVLGGLDRLAAQDGGVGVVLGVGYPDVKHRIVQSISRAELSWPVVVHPAASIGAEVKLSRGALVQAGTVLSVNIDVWDFATVNIGATVSHDCSLGPFSTVSPGASLGGRVSVEEGAFIGVGATVIQNISLGAWSVVGAGAVVLDDVPPNAVVAGIPARVIKTRPEGWQHD
jgi:sugar O-acyltransferase (sialic acid O-acetyltransferase NeuD family)